MLSNNNLANVVLNVGGIGCWTTSQFQALSADAFGSVAPLLTATEVNLLGATQFSRLNDQQVKSLNFAEIGKLETSVATDHLNAFNSESHTVLGVLTEQQLQLVAGNSVDQLIQSAANDVLWIHKSNPTMDTSSLTVISAINAYTSMHG